MAKQWFKLNRWQQFIVFLCLLVLVPVMPELLLVVDIGGLEMLVALTMLYFRPAIVWLRARYDDCCRYFVIAQLALKHSPLSQQRVWLLQGTFSSIAMLLTSSLIVAFVLWLPALLFLN